MPDRSTVFYLCSTSNFSINKIILRIHKFCQKNRILLFLAVSKMVQHKFIVQNYKRLLNLSISESASLICTYLFYPVIIYIQYMYSYSVCILAFTCEKSRHHTLSWIIFRRRNTRKFSYEIYAFVKTGF